MTTGLAVTNDLGALYFRGSRLVTNVRNVTTDCSIDMSVEQVSQLSLSLEDPGFALLNLGILDTGIYVDYGDLRLQVATSEANPGKAGMGGVTINARPYAVQKLKSRTGALVLKNVSASQFVISECQQAGVKYLVQPSARVKVISRDVPDKNNAATNTNRPSSWTTFQRLAGELGYYCYESSGTIGFGSPSWFAKIGPRVYASWRYGDQKYWMPTPPVCTHSVDNGGMVQIALDVPASRAAAFRPGMVLVLGGVPRFNGGYLVTSVSYSLMDMTGKASVAAQTPMNLLTDQAVPITTNIAFPSTNRSVSTSNTKVFV